MSKSSPDKFGWFPYNGSKRWMLTHLEPLFQAWSGKGRFIDPFCGGGAPSWLARKTHPDVNQILSDVDPWLLACYRVQTDGLRPTVPTDFTNLKDWYLLGDEDLPRLSHDERALRFLITNLTAWGHRLVPQPKGTLRFTADPAWTTAEYLVPRLVGLLDTRWLHSRDVVAQRDWKETVAGAREGDLVFLDPPYTETLGYTSKWMVSDQIDVWEMSEILVKRGCSVVLTNHGEMERLYARLSLSTRVINRPGTGKTGKPRQELLVWSPDLNPAKSIFES